MKETWTKDSPGPSPLAEDGNFSLTLTLSVPSFAILQVLPCTTLCSSRIGCSTDTYVRTYLV